uniref:Putative histone deacetylase HDT1 n=1 Tax=Davidia involucrata TaxID=16924 RepID=A0A5B6YTV9_DAVIN
MEFWGVEVKSGEPITVDPGNGMVLHLSQACLGEVKGNGNESVCLYVNIDGKKLVLGTLSPEKLPQQQFDLVFERDFELSHNWKNGSVYFYGYMANNIFDDSENDSGSDSEEDLPFNAADNGKPKPQAKQEKPPAPEKANAVKSDSAVGKQKVKIVEPNKDVKPEEDEESSEDLEDDSFDYTSDDESDSIEDSGSGTDEDDESDEEDEETPKKVELSKKRPAESANKTPGLDKKAKLVTPQKTDGKKGGGHVATPHPSKQAGKTPANQTKQQTPKPVGSHPCQSCNRSFNSQQALESHTKAKHSAGK